MNWNLKLNHLEKKLNQKTLKEKNFERDLFCQQKFKKYTFSSLKKKNTIFFHKYMNLRDGKWNYVK